MINDPNFDFSKINISADDIKSEVDKQRQNTFSDNLRKILETSAKLKARKVNDIRFSAPLITQKDNPVIFPHTINIIQGQAGVHKSRLAEYICAALIKRPTCTNELLGFKRTSFDTAHTLLYVDTERNLSEQFPYALQSLQMKAGYDKKDHPQMFEYISLLQIPRSERYTALNEYLEHIKKGINSPLFIVLDVSTDCIEDFNRTDKSMELIDLMNMTINEHNVVFLCLIHENPGSSKARGHFGTELMNKASTVMQVSYEKDSKNNDTELIRVKYLKCRSTARHLPFHVRYCNQENGLVLAEPEEVADLSKSRQQKAALYDVLEHLQMYLGDGSEMKRIDLIKKLETDFDVKQRTIDDRLKEIINNQHEIPNPNGQPFLLDKKKSKEGLSYMLIPHS